MAITATFTANFTNFLDAVRAADAKLKDFGDGANKVGGQLDRMANSLTGKKLVQEAMVMVKAVEDVGGVSKLTSAELERVSSKAAEAAEKMKKLGMDVPKGLNDLADAGKKSMFSLDGLVGKVTALAGGFLAVEAVLGGLKTAWGLFTGFLTDSIKSAADAENAQAQLTAALRAQGTAMPSVIAAYDGYAEQLQKTTVFSDDAAQAAMGLLVQIGDVMPKDMEKALDATANLASGMKIDLSQAAEMVAKAAAGQTTSLNKLGIETKDAEGKTKDFAGILDAINDKFTGQAAAAANTYAGRLAQMANAWDNVKESVGRAITSNATIIGLIDGVKNAVVGETGELANNQRVMNFVSDAAILLVQGSSLLVRAFGAVAQIVGRQVEELAGLSKAFLWVIDVAIKFYKLMGGDANPLVAKQLAMLEKLRPTVEGFGAAMGSTKKFLDGVVDGSRALASSADQLADRLKETRGQTVALTTAQQENTAVWNKGTKAVVDHAAAQAAAKKAAEEAAKWTKQQNDYMGDLMAHINEMRGFGDAWKTVGQNISSYVDPALKAAVEWTAMLGKGLREVWDDVGKGRDQWANVGTTIKSAGDATGVLTGKTHTWLDSLSVVDRILSNVQTKYAQTTVVGVRAAKEINAVWQKGAKDSEGNALKLGDKIGTTIMAGASAAASMFGDSKAGEIASSVANMAMTGAAIGSIIPGIGTGIGAAVGAAVGGIKKLFGKGEKGKVDEMRQAFIDQIGGWEGLNQAAAKAGVTLDNVLNAKKVKDYEAAVNELNAAVQFQDQAMATLTETASRYGFTLEELGPAMQRQELDKQAQQLFKDWEVLNAAGIDTVAITSRMSESINSYLAQAITMGTEVPNAMRPMLEKMVEMGQLTDASGNRIDNLEDSGISFSMTMSEGFKALIDVVGKLTTAISRGLGLAIDSTTDKINKMPKTVGVDVVYRDPGFHAPAVEVSGGNQDMESYQEGSEGFRNFGAGTPVMLHDWEAVVPMKHSTGRIGLTDGPPAVGGQSVVININANGAFFDTPGDLQRLADKVNEALTAKFGLTNRMRAA